MMHRDNVNWTNMRDILGARRTAMRAITIRESQRSAPALENCIATREAPTLLQLHARRNMLGKYGNEGQAFQCVHYVVIWHGTRRGFDHPIKGLQMKRIFIALTQRAF